MITLGWFSTGRGEGSLGLLRFVQERILRGEIGARIQFVFSNRDPGEGEGSDCFQEQVRSYGLPLVTFSSRKFRKEMGKEFASQREEYDDQVLIRLKEFTPDVCVLAGYMLIVGKGMCNHYPMLNLHPALPDGPVGTWQEVIWSLIESRAKQTGAMVHLVTEEVDRGPVVTYFTLPIVGGAFDRHRKEIGEQSLAALKASQGQELPLFRMIRQEEYRREPYLLVSTLNALASGAVKVEGRQVLDNLGRPLRGLCMDSEIEETLRSG